MIVGLVSLLPLCNAEFLSLISLDLSESNPKTEITYTLGLHCGRVNFAIENYTGIELVGLINEMRNEIPFCTQLVIDWDARLGRAISTIGGMEA